jgi:hypothetical protein
MRYEARQVEHAVEENRFGATKALGGRQSTGKAEGEHAGGAGSLDAVPAILYNGALEATHLGSVI